MFAVAERASEAETKSPESPELLTALCRTHRRRGADLPPSTLFALHQKTPSKSKKFLRRSHSPFRTPRRALQLRSCRRRAIEIPLGASGTIGHTGGIQDAPLYLTINTDREARYGMVTDADKALKPL